MDGGCVPIRQLSVLAISEGLVRMLARSLELEIASPSAWLGMTSAIDSSTALGMTRR